jgi:alcohol dehydrogenase (NADP+)
MRYLALSANDKMPALGLGTWKSGRGEVYQAVTSAIDLGYRHLDCAPIYQNEKEVGEALRLALKSDRLKREDLWLTSKLWNDAHAPKDVQPALEASLKDLGLDYLDLFLIHWPVHFRPGVVFPRQPEQYLPYDTIPLSETWQAMERLVHKGLCRFIGVCNFGIARLASLQRHATIPPAVNQIELHPYLAQAEMVRYCREQQILLTAYSPLGSGDRPEAMKKADEPSLLTHPTTVSLAEKYCHSPAQILIAWALARGTAVIPKSVNRQRQGENLAAAKLTLEDSDREALDRLDRGYRYVDGSFFTGPGSPYRVEDLWEGA